MLGLDWSVVWIIVNLLVLYALLKRFLFKPVCEMMDKRAKLIQDSLDEAEEKSPRLKGSGRTIRRRLKMPVGRPLR